MSHSLMRIEGEGHGVKTAIGRVENRLPVYESRQAELRAELEELKAHYGKLGAQIARIEGELRQA